MDRYPGHGSEELILLKYPQYSKPYIDSMQSIKFPIAFFTETEKKKSKNSYGTTKDPE